MNNTTNTDDDDDDLPCEIDFSNAKRDPNRYAVGLAGTTLVKLDRDIAVEFDSWQKVDDALRKLLHLNRREYSEHAERQGPLRNSASKLPPIPPERLVTMIAVEDDLMKVFDSPEKVNAALRALMEAKSARKKSA